MADSQLPKKPGSANPPRGDASLSEGWDSLTPPPVATQELDLNELDQIFTEVAAPPPSEPTSTEPPSQRTNVDAAPESTPAGEDYTPLPAPMGLGDMTDDDHLLGRRELDDAEIERRLAAEATTQLPHLLDDDELERRLAAEPVALPASLDDDPSASFVVTPSMVSPAAAVPDLDELRRAPTAAMGAARRTQVAPTVPLAPQLPSPPTMPMTPPRMSTPLATPAASRSTSEETSRMPSAAKLGMAPRLPGRPVGDPEAWEQPTMTGTPAVANPWADEQPTRELHGAALLPSPPAMPPPTAPAMPAAMPPRHPTPLATPAAEPPPRPVHVGPPTPLSDNGLFRQESQKLARARDWSKLAALTSDAVDQATWAILPETRAALLVDLARIHRDRLKDIDAAEATFRRLALVDPGNADAIDFLSGRYRERGDYRALHDLYAAAIENTWDPNQRLAWTRETVAIATDRLKSTDLAIEAWERLWKLGDAVDETSRALSQVYRQAKRWDRLAEFLSKRAAQLAGAERIVLLREVAEAYLSGLRDHDRAAAVLEQILSELPVDPVALLAMARVLARRKDWEALAELGARSTAGMNPAAALDFRRIVADALWTAGDLERALVAWERVLELDANDADALKAKEEYLARTGKTEQLVGFLSTRAERASSDEQRGKLLARAAVLAEKELDDPRLAIALWERRVALPRDKGSEGTLEAEQALVSLYDGLGDNVGVARALEGQLALTRQPAARIELLRRLGDHAAHRLGDDVRAESCWKEVLSIVPDDWTVREELIALQRRRGDFEALDRTLSGQAQRQADDAGALRYWRAAARNIEDNIPDSERAIRAWLRVLDLAPGDADALQALTQHQRSLGRPLGVIQSVEAELRTQPAGDARVDRGLDIARLWEGQADRAAALAAYERVLVWKSTHPTALAALAKLRGPAQAGAALGAIDVAAAALGDAGQNAERIELLEQGAALVDAADKLGRFFALRRLLYLSGRDPARVGDLAHAAAEAGAWSDLAAVYLDLAAEAPNPDARSAYHRELATLYKDRLKDPVRAFLTLQAVGQEPITRAGVAEALAELSQLTGRHEDLLSLLDVSARAGSSLETRQSALRARASICETRIGDAERAFHEWVRLLALDPHDADALASARRLAESKQLWRQLDALYGELWDRADGTVERMGIARARHAIRAERLADPSGALDQLLVIHRLAPDPSIIAREIADAADRLQAWERVLPIMEARARSAGEAASPLELVRLGQLTEEKRGDKARALELYAEAFVLSPSVGVDGEKLDQRMERLAETPAGLELVASAYRAAAARSKDSEQVLELYRRVAQIYADKLTRKDAALDIHTRILQLAPSALPSLEVAIENQRSAGNWRELRDRLQQWIELSPQSEPAVRVARWLEIARISRQNLADPETALATYSQILEVEPHNEEAHEGVRSLTQGPMEPSLELRRLRIELGRATGPRRAELELSMAKLQEEQLDDAAGATVTLRTLITESGADGPGFEPLAALLRRKNAWTELVELIEARADVLTEPAARIAAFEQALVVCAEHPADTESEERLCRRLLGERPADAGTRRRLLALYRRGARHQELADLLTQTLAGLPKTAQDERVVLEGELARVLVWGLGARKEAEALLAERVKRDPDDEDALLHLASLRLKSGDFAGWLALREQRARKVEPVLGAIILCHLAEACDERPDHQAKVAGYYRDARMMDATCAPALEALKAIGRRAKNWRATAALLPEPDEAKLSWSDRAAHLKARGDAASATDPRAAEGWYVRAVAVDPDHYPSWDALAAHAADPARALEAERWSLAAFERATPPDPKHLGQHAERIEKLAEALRAIGEDAQAAELSLRAYDLMPTFAAAALSVADQRLAQKDVPAAYAIYDRVLGAGSLGDRDRLHATFQRGALAAELGKPDLAIADLREGLRIDALHSGVLNALAAVLAQKGRVAAAVQHYIQALLVEATSESRGLLYARLGRLWEDRLARPDEAGVCYDLALASGPGASDDRELMSRALRHYRRSGHPERALEVIARILPATTDPRELASLWTERGDILRASNEDQAIEAYDMALSYDPGSSGALAGLSATLEKRGDWEQLTQIFEARAESGGPAERAEALRALAKLATNQLHDADRAEKYLREVVELSPTKDDYERLIALLGDDPGKAEARRGAIAGLLGVSGPWMARVIELGRGLVASGDRRWAWAVLSLLMQSNLPDPALKSMVLDLRKEFEKSDNSTALSPETRLNVRHPELQPALLGVIAELDNLVSMGPTNPGAVGAGGVARLDTRTAAGKTFAAVAGQLGMDGAVLDRALELPHSFVILDAEVPHVLIRSEVLQLLPVAETNFLFASLLELARPGVRLLMSLPPLDQRRLVPAVLAACGLIPATPDLEPMVAVIKGGVEPGKLASWADRLREHGNAGEAGAVAAGERLLRGVTETARRVGLVAAADLRFVARLLTRLDENLAKMPTVGKLDDIDAFIAGAAPVQSLLSFAASSAFGRALTAT